MRAPLPLSRTYLSKRKNQTIALSGHIIILRCVCRMEAIIARSHACNRFADSSLRFARRSRQQEKDCAARLRSEGPYGGGTYRSRRRHQSTSTTRQQDSPRRSRESHRQMGSAKSGPRSTSRGLGHHHSQGLGKTRSANHRWHAHERPPGHRPAQRHRHPHRRAARSLATGSHTTSTARYPTFPANRGRQFRRYFHRLRRPLRGPVERLPGPTSPGMALQQQERPAFPQRPRRRRISQANRRSRKAAENEALNSRALSEPTKAQATTHQSADRESTGLISTTGVPSIASSGPTLISRPEISSTFTRCSPSGFGRSGDRVAKTPHSTFLFPRGCTFKTSRRP